MKTILLWDLRFPLAAPVLLTIADEVASAFVRAGVAAAADPADAGALAAGAPIDPAEPTGIVIWSGWPPRPVHVVVPRAAAAAAIDAGVAAIGGGDTPSKLATIDLDRYLFWASRARVAAGPLVTAASGTNFVMTKLIFGSPQYAVNKLRLHLSGFASTEGGNSPQETILPGNAMTINGVWVEVGGVATRAKFGGANGTSVASGTTGAWTDEIVLPSDIPAGTLVAIYTSYSTAVAEKQIPVYQVQKERGERVWGAGDAASLDALIGTSTVSTAALDTGYGASSQPFYYGPDMMAAKGWDGRPVALVVGDSIAERQSDHVCAADARGNMGWLRRWLDKADPTYGRTPHFMLAIPGASSVRELSTSATLRWDVLDELIALNGGKRPFTCVLNQHGRNDYNATYATMKANWKDLNTRILARHPGVPIIGVGQVVHPNSTDAFRTLANQGYQAGGEWPGGVRYQLEADKEALMDGTLSGYIEVVRACGLDALLGRWPEPSFVTSLAANTGSSYSSITLADAPILGDFLQWGGGATPTGANVVEVTGSPGAWVATLDRTLGTSFVAGTEVFAPNANDGSGTPRTGTHPRARMVRAIADAVPQSAKAVLK